MIRTFHVDAETGDDARSAAQAQSAATPWRSISRVNKAMTQAAPAGLGGGDAVLFQRGQTFPGTLTIKASGGAACPLVFAGEGLGTQFPLLSGAEVVAGPFSESNGVFSATVPFDLPVLDDKKAPRYRVYVDGVELVPARSPNTGLFAQAQAASQTQLTAASLGQDDYAGATVWVRTEPWARFRGRVASQNGDTLTLASPLFSEARPGAGFIIENALSALDAPGEFYLDAKTKKLSIVPPDGAKMATARVEISVHRNAVLLSTGPQTVKDVTLRGLAFGRAVGESVTSAGGPIKERVHFEHDIFERSEAPSLQMGESNSGFIIERSRFDGAWNHTANIFGGKMIVRRNEIVDQMTDPQRGQGFGFTVTTTPGLEPCIVEENYVARSGSRGLAPGGVGTIIRRNLVVDSMLLEADGGAIYAYGSDVQSPIIRDNLVVGALGSGVGDAAKYDVACGIYMDNQVQTPVVEGNTVFGADVGIFFNTGGTSPTANGNTVVGGLRALQLNTRGKEAKGNLLLTAGAKEFPLLLDAGVSATDPPAKMSGNVYGRGAGTAVAREGLLTFDLAAWQAATKQDADSTFIQLSSAPFSTLPDGGVWLVANPTLGPIDVVVPDGWLELDGAKAPASIVVPSFASHLFRKP